MYENAASKLAGSLLAGAMGDALGYPIEFMNLDSIHRDIGKDGVTKLTFPGESSDDTQMMLFTAEAICENKPETEWIETVHKAYMRWYYTQTYEKIGPDQNWYDGLLTHNELFRWAMPGSTCMHMLSKGVPGSIDKPANQSKGCGGIMRVAPCAVLSDPFMRACEAAAVTHDHPSGYLSAGAHAQILADIISGTDIDNAILHAKEKVSGFKGCEEVLGLIDSAQKLAASKPADVDALESLGGGWTGEETLGIALYCVLSCPDDFEKAMLLSVNHSGDSDSTGMVCGNIMGAMLGKEALPQSWCKVLELYDLVESFVPGLMGIYKKNH